jgi:autophagy-related protein 13
MARTIYSYARVLPAYRLYRSCRDHRASHFNISYRISSDLPAAAAALPPQPMERFAFAPIGTLTGTLLVSVKYVPVVGLGLQRPAQPVSIPQHVITDYVRPVGVPSTMLFIAPIFSAAVLSTSSALRWGECSPVE